MTPAPRFMGFPYPEPWLERWVADVRQDVRYAIRQMRRAPGFTAVVVGTLAIGIGANVMMASVLDALLLRPPPGINDPGSVTQLVYASSHATDRRDMGRFTSYPAVLDFARDVPAFADVAAYASRSLSLGVGPDAIRVRSTLVTPNFFSLLGVHAALGRLFSGADGFPVDGGAGGPALVVLGYGFWRRQFAGDGSVLGRSILLGSLSYTVVGVTPPGFRGVQATAPDVWLPATVTASAEEPAVWSDGAGSTWLTAVARLRPGASRAVAAAQATAVMRHAAAHPELDTLYHVIPASVIAGRGPDAPQQTTVLIWLGGLSALVLLIACANVANLLLGRAVIRRREVAVRLALGAGRGRLARQLVAESLVLVSLGGAAACYLAVIGSRALQARLLPGTSVGGVLNVRLIAITALVALGATAILALAPWLQSVGLDLMRALKGVGGTADVQTARTRTALLGVQAAIGMVLMVTAVLATQSLRRVLAHDLGVDVHRTAVVYFDLDRLLRVPGVGLDSMYGLLTERLRALPGVQRVALADASYGYGHAAGVYTLEHDDDYYWQHVGMVSPMEAAVDSGFFRTMGAYTLRGRDFDTGDRRGAPRVAIINEALGHYLWPGKDALGQCLLLHEPPKNANGPCVAVIGVIPTFQLYDMFNQETFQVYVPLAQNTYPSLPAIMYIRTRGDAATVIPSVRRAILTARPDLPAPSVASMQDVVAPQLRPWRLAALLFSLFGAVAVVIAVVGLYGVVAFAAAHRARELAIRRTLGANARDVLRAVAGDALRTVLIALLAGSGVILSAHRVLDSVLYQTTARNPWVIGGTALTLLLAAIAASVLPVLHALRTNPAVILREASSQ